MRTLLFILLVMCNIIVVAQDNEEWCRPVKEDVVLDPLDGNKGPRIKVFQYEWFVVQKKEAGHPKLSGQFYDGRVSGKFFLDNNKKDVRRNHESLHVTMLIYKDTLYVNVPKTDNTRWYKVIDQSNNRYIKNNVVEFDKYVKFFIPDSCSVIRISPDNRIVSIFNKSDIKKPIITSRIDTIQIEGSDSLRCLTYRQLCANDTIIVSEYVTKTEIIAKDKGENIILNILITILLTVIVGVIVYFCFYKKKGNKEEQDINIDEETESSFGPKENPREEIEAVHDKDNTDVEDGIDHLIEQLRYENKKSLEKIENQEQEILKLQPFKDNFEKEIQKIEADKKKEIEKIKENFEVEINNANNERDKALKEVKTISKELEEKFDKERKTLTNERDDAKDAFVKKSAAYDELHKLKEQIANQLQLKENEVVRLEQGQQMFTSKLTFVPFAAEYAKKIVSLFELSELIQAKITGVLEMDIDDPYHIMKAVTKYSTSISTIDMKMFYTDVKMISEGQMTLNSTTLAGLDQNSDKESLDAGMRMYFFDRYLEKYVDALMVLNESMAGIHHLISSMPVDETRIFDDYREQLLKTVADLGLKVDSVKLFDKVGSKIGLSATLVDAGFSTGDILEIENCIVYFENGRRPETKIRVKVQE